jgi:hypothetical protein
MERIDELRIKSCMYDYWISDNMASFVKQGKGFWQFKLHLVVQVEYFDTKVMENFWMRTRDVVSFSAIERLMFWLLGDK